MATTHTPPKSAATGYALLEFSGAVILPADTAAKVFALMCEGTFATYEYNTRGYKRSEESLPTLKPFTAVNMAKLALESDD